MTSELPEKRMFVNVFSRRLKRSSSNPSGDIEAVPPGISSDAVLSQETAMNTDTIPEMSSSPVQLQAKKKSSDPIPCQAKNMSTSSFAEHLERIWRRFPADKLVQFTYFDCLWFTMYRNASDKTKVLSWITKKNIYSTNYVFVPICCWSHWNVLILCHFNQRRNSKKRKPCMLLLDSLHLANPTRMEMDIRKFALDIYQKKGFSGQRVSEIPLVIPKVPQQKNKECGYFALYFIKRFMEAVLDTASYDISSIDKDWFTREELDGFCIELEEESRSQREVEALTIQKKGRESREGDVIVLHDDDDE